MTLSEQELKEIILKRRKWLAENSIQDWTDGDTLHVVIAAATLYQERAKPVLEALQEMLRQFKPEFQNWNQQAAVEHAMEALTNFNESLKG